MFESERFGIFVDFLSTGSSAAVSILPLKLRSTVISWAEHNLKLHFVKFDGKLLRDRLDYGKSNLGAYGLECMMSFRKWRIAPVFAGVFLGVVAFAASSASAATYSFFNITNNSATNAATGEAQLSMDVTDVGGGFVLFTFSNVGPLASSITDVYFDDSLGGAGVPGVLAGNGTVFNGSGVSFSFGASPGNLPGGNEPAYSFSVSPVGASADSDSPTAPRGVNPGESLGLSMALLGGVSFADVIAALDAGGVNTGLRIGLHVQAFSDGGSESFINRPSPVPLPAAAWLLLSAIGGMAMLGRRRRAA